MLGSACVVYLPNNPFWGRSFLVRPGSCGMSIQTDMGEVKGKLSAKGPFLLYQGHETKDKGQN